MISSYNTSISSKDAFLILFICQEQHTCTGLLLETSEKWAPWSGLISRYMGLGRSHFPVNSIAKIALSILVLLVSPKQSA